MTTLLVNDTNQILYIVDKDEQQLRMLRPKHYSSFKNQQNVVRHNLDPNITYKIFKVWNGRDCVLSVTRASNEMFHYEVTIFQMDGKGNLMLRCTIMKTLQSTNQHLISSVAHRFNLISSLHFSPSCNM